MKRNDLKPGMHVFLKDKSEAYVLQTSGWELIKTLRGKDVPDFKIPVVMFENAYDGPGEDTFIVHGGGLPGVAVAVLRTFPAYKHAGVKYPEQTLWIPRIVKCDDVECTWKRHLELLEEEKKQKEEQERREEERKNEQREKEYFKERLRRILSTLGLERIEFPGCRYGHGDESGRVTEENDIILDMYELEEMLKQVVYHGKDEHELPAVSIGVECSGCGKTRYEPDTGKIVCAICGRGNK